MKKLVRGVGINDGKYPIIVSGKIYSLWVNMLERCYQDKYKEIHPTYIGCYVSEGFKNYTYFFEWCQNQIGFNNIDYTLDKDLLIKGNKIYSEDNCVFIPKILNLLLTNRKLDRGMLPIGVSKSGSNFRARCKKYNVYICLGTYSTPELAFTAYKTFKEAHIKELAEKYKDTIDPRAYLALMNYEVHIDD